ncbi:hypothetical protein HF863_05390 [Lactobacillus agilis]|nr:hypothetical protein [Ligilactobacillus agilis]NME42199.1 hypothetical protein [Ligilactobacillus agilis]
MEMTLNVSEDFLSQLLREGKKEGITINVVSNQIQTDKKLMTAKDLKMELSIGDEKLQELLAEGLPIYEKSRKSKWFYYPEVIEWIRKNRRV